MSPTEPTRPNAADDPGPARPGQTSAENSAPEADDDDFKLGAGIDLADPNGPLAPYYLSPAGVLLVLFLAFVFFVLSRGHVYHTDVWGHLRFGEYMAETGRLPTREMFSGDFADQDALYVNFQWVAQLGAYLVFAVGRHLAQTAPDGGLGGGAALLGTVLALVVTLRLALVFCALRRLTGSSPAALLGVVVSAAMAWVYHIGVLRPQILGELAFAALLVPLSRPVLSRRALVLLPVVFVLWANCHGSFLMGFVLLGTVLVGRALEVVRDNVPSPLPPFRFSPLPAAWAVWGDTQVRRLSLALVVSAGAVAVLNPHGPMLPVYIVRLSNHPNIGPYMEEWKPIPLKDPAGPFGLAPVGLMFLVTVLLLVPLLRRSPARFTPAQVLLLLGFGLQSAAHARVLVWWSMVLPWVAVPHLHALLRRPGGALDEALEEFDRQVIAPVFPRWRLRRPSFLKTVMVVPLSACFVLLSVPGAWVVSGQPPEAASRLKPETPVAAVEYLRKQYGQHPDLDRVVFTSETLGDFVLWDLRLDPPVRVFCYSHVHLFTPEHWRECFLVKSADRRWQEVLDRHKVQFLLLETELYGHLIRQVRAAPDRWQVVSDDGPVLIAKRVRSPRP